MMRTEKRKYKLINTETPSDTVRDIVSNNDSEIKINSLYNNTFINISFELTSPLFARGYRLLFQQHAPKYVRYNPRQGLRDATSPGHGTCPTDNGPLNRNSPVIP
ncbi:hypothetical protein J6590_101502 [Homalodisca vitripennis]|nr:hypothetical protein J6590_019259 [Homalodisca vitripennis]KAG8324048.1 hypothetical protein J6590_101502 [Homalodisca vitripennis]